MKRNSYQDQDYAFGQIMLNLRNALMLTQAGLASVLGVSRNSVADWEAGRKYPKFENLKALIALGFEQSAFTAGHEVEEAQALWNASRQKVLLDEMWLTSLIAPTAVVTMSTAAPTPQSRPRALNHQRSFGFPFQPTGFVGRSAEITEIAEILRNRASRLLTLIGPGGVGKTRLALEVAQSQLNAYADGVGFVSLAPVSAPNQIVSAIGDTLQLSFGNEANPATHLLDYLHERHLLLVLDNFEHLLEGAALVYEILERAPQVTLLITSRERLKLRAEWLYDVQGLSYPASQSAETTEQLNQMSLSRYSAVQLFIQRATQVQPGFPLSETTLRAIVDICQHVVGMPLAIELAAAAVRRMPVVEIDRQISSNLEMLATTLQDVPARHRSLRAVFDHSWNMMTEKERASFTRLAVFRGGFTENAAREVAGAALPTLMALVDQSMVRQVNSSASAGEMPRFFLLEPLREYALQMLDKVAMEALSRSHAVYFLVLAEAAQAQWQTPTAEVVLKEVDLEIDNMRAALQWAVSGGDAMLGLRIAEGLVRYWRSRVYLDEARQWLEALLALTGNESDLIALGIRMRTTYAAAMIFADRRDYAHAGVLFEQSRTLRHALVAGGEESTMLINQAQQARTAGEYQQATMLLEESLVLYRLAGDLNTFTSGGYGFVLYFLAHMLREQGDYARARALYLECREFHIQVGDREGSTQGLLGLSDVARDVGDAAEVRRYGNEALLTYREFGTQWAIGFCLNNLALAAYLDHDLNEAFALISESVAMFRAQKSAGSVAEVLVTLGAVLLARGDLNGAYDALTESIRLGWVTGPRLLIAAALEGLGCALVARGGAEVQQAIQFLAAAELLRLQMSTPLRPADLPVYDHALADARVFVGEAAFAEIWREAQLLSLEQVVSEIIGAKPDAHQL